MNNEHEQTEESPETNPEDDSLNKLIMVNVKNVVEEPYVKTPEIMVCFVNF